MGKNIIYIILYTYILYINLQPEICGPSDLKFGSIPELKIIISAWKSWTPHQSGWQQCKSLATLAGMTGLKMWKVKTIVIQSIYIYYIDMI